ncbi:thiol reductase thioredoxin [Marinomonas primoryensis]|uniref:Thiol reductase thioredoxin n=1 Tax=Marinomonas primoryensis TaxID=178399 RepID=A0A2Z4PVW4_9GAMM|nr:thioredoxin family protein [Marinomonas primoryensis]AWY01716.1 thiol reductase thioredoxin [Marinomonas primoryensis]
MQATRIGFNPEYSEDAPSLDELNGLVGNVLLEFGTPWCGHCQASRSAIEEVMLELPDLAHIKVFDGKGKRLGRQFSVTLWPTLILLHDGKEVGRVIRFTTASEVRKLMSLSV